MPPVAAIARLHPSKQRGRRRPWTNAMLPSTGPATVCGCCIAEHHPHRGTGLPSRQAPPRLDLAEEQDTTNLHGREPTRSRRKGKGHTAVVTSTAPSRTISGRGEKQRRVRVAAAADWGNCSAETRDERLGRFARVRAAVAV